MPRKAKEKKAEATSLWTTYTSVEQLQKAVDQYFQKCDDDGIPYGEAGLAISLNVSMKKTLQAWYDGKKDPEFQETVEMAYQRIAEQFETGYDWNHDKTMSRKALKLMENPRFQDYKNQPDQKTDVTVHVKFGGGVDESDFD